MSSLNYSLRSQCRRHGSCNCRNAPDLPNSSRRRSPRNKSSSLDEHFHHHHHNSSDSSDSDFDEISQTSTRYQYYNNTNSVVSSHSYNHNNCNNNVSTANLSDISDSDYNTNSDSSVLLLSQSEKKLRSILINSAERSSRYNNGYQRNVTFGFATSTPLSSIQNKDLYEYEDLRENKDEEEDVNSLQEEVQISGEDTTMSYPARSSRNKITSQNFSKFSNLEESGGRRGVAYTSVNRRSESFEQLGVGSSTTHHEQHDKTFRVTRSNSRVPASLHSRDSEVSAFGPDGRVIRRRRQVPIIDDHDNDKGEVFMTPSGNGTYLIQTGNYGSGDDFNNAGGRMSALIRTYCSSFVNLCATIVTFLASGPIFVWSQVMRFVGLPLYWLLVQCLVSEKWALEKNEGDGGGGSRRIRRLVRSNDDGGNNYQSWFSRFFSYFSWSQTKTLAMNSNSSFHHENSVKNDEFFSDDEGAEGNNMHRNLNGGSGVIVGDKGKNYANLNGHSYDQSITQSTTGRVRGLLQNARTKLFSGSLTTNNLFGGGGASSKIVGVSKIGSIAGWGKNLLVCWRTNETKNQSHAGAEHIVSDDESEDDSAAVVASKRSLEIGFKGERICKFLTKLCLLLLLLMAFGYLVYLLLPLLVRVVCGAWEASKQPFSSFLQFISSSFATSMEVGTMLISSFLNFSSSLGAYSSQNTAYDPEFDTVAPIIPVKPSSAPPPPPLPPAVSKEEYEALLHRIIALEAQLKANEGKISTQDAIHQKEINDMRQVYESYGGKVDQIEDSISLKMMDEINHQVKISCVKNCPEPEVQPTPPSPQPAPVVGESFDESKIQGLINKAIQKYDADKTGRPDLALESGGGSILNTRCTKSSKLRNSVVSFWGFKIWSPPNNPRIIIQPGVVPGECWAFEGSVGDVVIKLVSPATLTGFTLEHISKLVSPYGNIDSAPYRFQVLGLDDVNDLDSVHDFGTYSYEDNGQSLQYFDVLNPTTKSYAIVELKILSNHGNLHHTCLYRFRVHGNLADWLSTPFTSTVITSNSPVEESNTDEAI